MKYPKYNKETVEKYWEEDWGLAKYYRCLSCEHGWHIGPDTEEESEPPEDQRLRAVGAPTLPGME